MREIKFDLIYKGETGFHHKKYHLCELMRGIGKICDIHSIMELVAKRQYTDRKDPNGKEIYEGDVLATHHYDDPDEGEKFIYHQVVFREEYALWVALNLSSKSYTDGSPPLHVMKNSVVCGNIYENPELLSIDQSA